MADIGHEVVGIDIDQEKVDSLSAGNAPFFEPGLSTLLRRNVSSGRLSFSTDSSAIRGAQVHFIGVGTPQSSNGAADLTYVDKAVEQMLPHLGACESGAEIVAGKSTVPVGTASRLSRQIAATGATLVWNPEFLREGFAVKDTLEPDRLVYGLPDDPKDAQEAQDVLDAVYAPVMSSGTPRLCMDYATAELVKTAANAFLATKISFINAMARICDTVKADVTDLADAIGMDERIGHRFLRAGIGFGGGCLPKDIRAFQARADQLGEGETLAFLAEVDRINDWMRASVIDTCAELLGGCLPTSRIAILGATFKPDSDDMRNSPALEIATDLARRAGSVVVTDPQAAPILAVNDGLPYEVTTEAQDALADADLAILGTEWHEYTQLDPHRAARLMRHARIIDGRNALDPQAWKAAGFTYIGIGRR